MFGISPWHILVAEGILTMGHCHRQLEGWRKHSVTLETAFYFGLSIFIIYIKIHPAQPHVDETRDN